MKWRLCQIAEIFEVARGGSPRPIDNYLTDSPDGLNWIMISDASDGSKYITSTKRRIKPEGLKKTRMVHEGEFLLTNSMSFGRPYILKTSGCIHDGWLVLSPKSNDVFPDFFYYLLGSDTLYREFARRAAGAVVKNLNTALVKQVQIPLPPLPEQKRIAGILDAADALRAKRRESLAELDTLLQSTFLDMFGDPATNPMRWEVCELRVLGTITTGKTPPTKNKGMFGGDIPFATPSDLDDGLCSTARKITQKGEKFTKVVRAGSTLVGCIGTIGKMARSPVSTAFNQQINAIEWSLRVDDNFGTYALRHCIPQMLEKASSTTVPILNKSGFSSVSIIVPPLSLQHRFATVVKSVERQKARMRVHLAELDALFASLQSQAFTGAL